MGSTPLIRRCRIRCSLLSASGAAAATRGSLLHNGWLLHRRIGTSTLLSLSQPPSSLPSLRDCYRPSTLTEESTQKKEKAEKVSFYLRQQLLRKTNLDPIFSESRFGMIAHKNKKRITAGTQYQTKFFV
jgi:hypothetical protein